MVCLHTAQPWIGCEPSFGHKCKHCGIALFTPARVVCTYFMAQSVLLLRCNMLTCRAVGDSAECFWPATRLHMWGGATGQAVHNALQFVGNQTFVT